MLNKNILFNWIVLIWNYIGENGDIVNWKFMLGSGENICKIISCYKLEDRWLSLG